MRIDPQVWRDLAWIGGMSRHRIARYFLIDNGPEFVAGLRQLRGVFVRYPRDGVYS